MKTHKIIFLLILLGALIAACAPASTEATPAATVPPVEADNAIVAEGRVEPSRFVEIGFHAGGVVSEVLVKEGDVLKAGDVIARLSNDETRTLSEAQTDALQKMVDAYEEVRLAQIKMDDFDIPSDLRQMTPEQAVQYTYEKLEKARADYEPYKYINPRNDRREDDGCQIRNGVETCKDTGKYYKRVLDDAWAKYRKAIDWMERESALNIAKEKLEQAKLDYANLQEGADPEQTAGTRALLANGEMRAPFGGTVAKLDIKVGESSIAGKTVITIADFSSWVVKTTDLTEIDVVGISVGQTATVTLDAMPDKPLAAKVQSIGQTFAEKQGDVVYEVTLVLTDSAPEIRWGMTAEVKFEK